MKQVDELHLKLLALGSRVTDTDLQTLADRLVVVPGEDTAALARLGITLLGRSDCTFLVANTEHPMGKVIITNAGSGNVFLLGNTASPRQCNLNIKVNGSHCIVAFPAIAAMPLHIAILLLRSDNQKFFWGKGATSVTTRIEIEGRGTGVYIGDHCMFSSGVWIRNHDMHTIFSTLDATPVNLDRGDMVIEQHVWLGFDAVVLRAERIGFGSIVGARGFVTRSIPQESLAVGLPARVIRQDVGWCRSPAGIAAATLERLGRLRGATK